jgi:hypothetical protein
MSAAALLSLTQQFTLHRVGYWKYPINQQDECFGGSIVLHMHMISWESSESSGKAEKQSNCEIGSNIMQNEGMMAGMGTYFTVVIDK